MKDDYLWDRSGPPDAEIERLERTLAPLRYRHRADLVRPVRQAPRVLWAVAAAAILMAASVWQVSVRPAQTSAWQVAGVEGAAHLGGGRASVTMPLRVGQLVRTGRDSQLTLQADELGKIDIGPESELRASTYRQVQLNRGLLHAFIWAPPRQFVVDTPSARAVDLGCEYTLKVEPSGDGLLRVAMGWVAFQFGGRESFIPAGASCITRQKQGPGIPYYDDAPAALRNGISDFENGDTRALDGLLASARPRDGLTLWHLLTRVPDERRAQVYDRFRQIVDVPAEVSREGVLRQDPAMIDRCWDALNLERTEWWRGWKREWK